MRSLGLEIVKGNEAGGHNGAPEEIRTPDPRFRKPLLYPTELQALISSRPTKSLNGRGGVIRTPDPLVPNQMRYQAALRPDILNNFQLWKAAKLRDK